MNTLQRPEPVTPPAQRNARSADAAAGIKNLQQLIELRWIAVVGQVFTIEMAHYSLALKLPLQEMLLVVGGLQRGEPAAPAHGPRGAQRGAVPGAAD